MLTFFRTLLHCIAHAFGTNEGHIESWDDHGRWMMGFRCKGCGQLRHVFELDKEPIR